MIERPRITSSDRWFGLVILLILGMGVLSIYSVASQRAPGASLSVYERQILWILVGWTVFFVCAFYDYHKIARYSVPFYTGGVALLVLVLMIGRTGRGAQRWLSLGFFDLQPSEWIKLGVILILARYLSIRHRPQGLGLRELLLPFILVVIPAALVLKQPDLGTTLAILFIFAVMIFLSGPRSTTVNFLVLIALMAFPFLWELFWGSLREYQRVRLMTFVNPDLDPLGRGYHALQSKIAVGSGGFLGKGLWGGTQSQLRFLPEGHTDFIFSVFAEAWGFLGVSLLLALYFLLIWWGIEAAYKAKDALGSLIAGGIVAWLVFYVIVNIGMAVGVAPVVGVPLPLMSYGGNAMVTTMAALGLILNIRMRRFMLFY